MNEKKRTVLLDRLYRAVYDNNPATIWIDDATWYLNVKSDIANEILEFFNPPLIFEISPDPDNSEKIIATWPCAADLLFLPGGILDNALGGYQVRETQWRAARLIEAGIYMGEAITAELPTGVGKSFLGLFLAAEMGITSVIGTSNKALQMQYQNKDLPFVQSLYPDLKTAVAVGKSNYVCMKKVESLKDDKELADIMVPIGEWLARTQTGNIEEVSLPRQDVQPLLLGDNCDKHSCPLLNKCHYYNNRKRIAEADIIVANHAYILADNRYPFADLLPNYDALFLDEAHQFPNYARNASEFRVTRKSIQRSVNKASSVGEEMDSELILEFFKDMESYKIESTDREIDIEHDHVFDTGIAAALHMHQVADAIWYNGNKPESAEDAYLQKVANGVRRTAEKLSTVSSKTIEPYTRWIGEDRTAIIACPYDVSHLIGSLAGFKQKDTKEDVDPRLCPKCETLHGETVYMMSADRAYCPDCILREDPFDESQAIDRTEWLDIADARLDETEMVLPVKSRKATIFMSATMATPDMGNFNRECGLPYTLEMIGESPFDFKNNSFLYIPNGDSPVPGSRGHSDWLSNQLMDLAIASGGACLYLFTSYKAMNEQYDTLRSSSLSRRGFKFMKQGDMPPVALIDKFKAADKAILFATKSMWEGVDCPGDDLVLTVMDKAPFPALSPLFQARSAHVESQGGHGFFDLSVPEATLHLKQGGGRTIRSSSDRGGIAILDARLTSKKYGQGIIDSLPDAPLIHDMEKVFEFFSAMNGAN